MALTAEERRDETEQKRAAQRSGKMRRSNQVRQSLLTTYPTLPSPDEFGTPALEEMEEDFNEAVEMIKTQDERGFAAYVMKHPEAVRAWCLEAVKRHDELITLVNDCETRITELDENLANERNAAHGEAPAVIPDEEFEALQTELADAKGVIRNLRANAQTNNAAGTEGRSARSAKLPDPEVFNDNVNKKLNQWIMAVRNKMRGNGDYYPTEEQKI